ISLLISGCGTSHYNAEKAFWYAETNSQRILKEKSGKLEESDYDHIINGYRKVTKVAPLDNLAMKSMFIITNIYYAQKRYDKAHMELNSIIQNFSSDKDLATHAFYLNGKIWEIEEKFNEAFLEYEKILDLYPLSNRGIEMPLYLFRFYQTHKDVLEYTYSMDRVITHYKWLIDEYSNTSYEDMLKNFLLRAYFIGEKWDEIINFWNSELSEKKEDIPLIMKGSIAKAEILSGKLNKELDAIDICKQLIVDYPEHSYTKEIKFKLSELYVKLLDFDNAINTLSEAINTYKDDSGFVIKSRMSLAKIFLLLKNNKGSLEQYDLIQTSYPDHYLSLSIPFMKFRFYKQTNDEENAKKQLEKSIEFYSGIFSKDVADTNDKSFKVAGHLLLVCRIYSENWDESIKLLEKLSVKTPGNPRYLFILASIYRDKLNQPEKAKEIYLKIATEFKNNQQILKSVNVLLETIEKNIKIDQIKTPLEEDEEL
ncbi:MAG: hypothetical protein ACD_79C01060G0002, partial [uncultured bacterium]